MAATIAALPVRLRDVMVRRADLFRASSWVVAAYILHQILRLVANIVLAALLAPALLGTMLLINTLRTAGELLTDVGIGQSIVHNPRGAHPDYLNTAWTIQIVRGVLLFLASLLFVGPIAGLYDDPQLETLLPVAALLFVIAGFTSPTKFVLQKRVETRKLASYTFWTNFAGTVITIALAWWMRDIWALIYGLLISLVVSVITSFFLLDWRMHRLKWDREAARSILSFGKWIFFSSLIYFAASNFDRLYLADAVPFAVLGVYGIARTYADTALNLFTHLCSQIVFPKISSSAKRGVELAKLIGPMRRASLFLVAIGLGAGIAVADKFVLLAYDARYAEAAIYLPILMVGAWFGTMAAISESILMGIGKPSNAALGNGAKFVGILALVPLALPAYGMIAAVAVFSLVELVRYAVLAWRSAVHGIHFVRQDVVATLVFVVAMLLFREMTAALGLTGDVMAWFDTIGAQFAG